MALERDFMAAQDPDDLPPEVVAFLEEFFPDVDRRDFIRKLRELRTEQMNALQYLFN
jgi:hypothetical protein